MNVFTMTTKELKNELKRLIDYYEDMLCRGHGKNSTVLWAVSLREDAIIQELNFRRK